MAISHKDRKGHFLPAFLVAILVASVILPTVSALIRMEMELMTQVMIALMLLELHHRQSRLSRQRRGWN